MGEKILERKRTYSVFPKKSLEWKIRLYVKLLEEGWGRSYAQAQSGLRRGRFDHGFAMRDPRVIKAHEQKSEAFRAKKKALWRLD